MEIVNKESKVQNVIDTNMNHHNCMAIHIRRMKYFNRFTGNKKEIVYNGLNYRTIK